MDTKSAAAMRDDERYVRERWNIVEYRRNYPYPAATVFIGPFSLSGWVGKFSEEDSPDKTWHAAAEFTRKRERHIANKKEEIKWTSFTTMDNPWGGLSKQNSIAIQKRILAVLEAQLADLTRGMKQ